MEKLISKSFERLVDKGLNRGFITFEELQKSLGKRNSNIELDSIDNENDKSADKTSKEAAE